MRQLQVAEALANLLGEVVCDMPGHGHFRAGAQDVRGRVGALVFSIVVAVAAVPIVNVFLDGGDVTFEHGGGHGRFVGGVGGTGVRVCVHVRVKERS